MRSASATIADVSRLARWPVRSMSRSIPTSSASSVAVELSQALVPALETLKSSMPRRLATFLASASAIALRHVFPLHTNRRFIALRIPDEVGHAFPQLRGGNRARPDHPRKASCTIDYRRWLGLFETAAVENAQRTTRDCVAPLRDDLVRRRGGRDSGSVGARRCERIAVRQDQPGERAMGRPPNCHSAFWSTKTVRNPVLPTREYQR